MKRFVFCLVLCASAHLVFGAALFIAYKLSPTERSSTQEGSGDPPPSEIKGFEIADTRSAPANPVADARIHTVKAGESHWAIANAHGVSVKDLKTANGHGSSYMLRVGEKLRIPTKH